MRCIRTILSIFINKLPKKKKNFYEKVKWIPKGLKVLGFSHVNGFFEFNWTFGELLYCIFYEVHDIKGVFL
jgi:hypothetical protein